MGFKGSASLIFGIGYVLPGSEINSVFHGRHITVELFNSLVAVILLRSSLDLRRVFIREGKRPKDVRSPSTNSRGQFLGCSPKGPSTNVGICKLLLQLFMEIGFVRSWESLIY